MSTHISRAFPNKCLNHSPELEPHQGPTLALTTIAFLSYCGCLTLMCCESFASLASRHGAYVHPLQWLVVEWSLVLFLVQWCRWRRWRTGTVSPHPPHHIPLIFITWINLMTVYIAVCYDILKGYAKARVTLPPFWDQGAPWALWPWLATARIQVLSARTCTFESSTVTECHGLNFTEHGFSVAHVTRCSRI